MKVLVQMRGFVQACCCVTARPWDLGSNSSFLISGNVVKLLVIVGCLRTEGLQSGWLDAEAWPLYYHAILYTSHMSLQRLAGVPTFQTA